MATSAEYCDYVVDMLSPIQAVRTRKMFGGIGIYAEEVMFALITSDDVLHFKTDDSNRPAYETAGMPQFMKMPYHQVPAEVLESPQELKRWVEKSVGVAQQTAKKKKDG